MTPLSLPPRLPILPTPSPASFAVFPPYLPVHLPVFCLVYGVAGGIFLAAENRERSAFIFANIQIHEGSRGPGGVAHTGESNI